MMMSGLSATISCPPPMRSVRCHRHGHARIAKGLFPILLLFLSLVFGVGCSENSQEPTAAFAKARAGGSSADREWRTYLGDRSVSHASPLDQIHRENVAELERAWVYDAGDLAEGTNSQIQFNPLVVKGVLYGVSPSLRVFALDASTGDELWSFEPDLEVAIWTTTRGAVYWEDGDDERLIIGLGTHLVALDARTGRLIPGFAEKGWLDLREGLGREPGEDPMGVVATTPGSLFEDLIIMGGRVGEMRGAMPGHVRAFDVRSGEQRWIFHTIPQPGEFGYETWPADAWQRSGGVNAWAGFAVDPERGLVFAPTGSPTFDFYGGDRAGDNLFANSLVTLDARTGERQWHRQIVRHDVWDRDLPSPPNLVEIDRGGVRIPAVAQVTKSGDTFLFLRETGEPLYPLREEPVQGEGVSGEVLAKSQPVPTLPPPFVRQGFTLDLVTDRTTEAQDDVLKRARKMRFGHLYDAPSSQGTIVYPGTDGGAEWGGAAWDDETGLLFVNANQVPSIQQLVEAPAEFDSATSLSSAYLMLCSSCHGLDLAGDGGRIPSLRNLDERMGFLETYRIVRDGRGHMPGFGHYVPWYGVGGISWWVRQAEPEDYPSTWPETKGEKTPLFAGYQNLRDVDGLPGSKPPWGTLTAIDLAAGEHAWQLPFGDYPAVLKHGLRGLGSENYGGPGVTAGGLLFIAATPDARLRAFDKRSGELLWESELPAAGFATPATYEAGGRQFVVVAAGGGKLGVASGSKYVAFALPK
ncbi:MAG: PQQ-binding-like beta-propeller repeat protein [Myxococcota bacterium]